MKQTLYTVSIIDDNRLHCIKTYHDISTTEISGNWLKLYDETDDIRAIIPNNYIIDIKRQA